MKVEVFTAGEYDCRVIHDGKEVCVMTLADTMGGSCYIPKGDIAALPPEIEEQYDGSFTAGTPAELAYAIAMCVDGVTAAHCDGVQIYPH